MQFAPLYPVIHRVLNPFFPACLWAGRSDCRAIALTFDDGPHPDHTPRLLEVLDRHQIPASFFWLGLCVERAPQVAKAIYERGHWIGLHGYDHRAFPSLAPAELKQSLEKTQAAIAAACELPGDRIRDVRPPNGLFTPRTLTLLQQWGYRPVMWSVVPEDWVNPGVDTVVQRVMQQVTNGSQIVLHDGYCGGSNVAAVADALIPRLLEQGYQFVTINDLWQTTIAAPAPAQPTQLSDT
jgi:peptidoglycan/xylan/chitin deacetylase (PgdA/CDA1 family)